MCCNVCEMTHCVFTCTLNFSTLDLVLKCYFRITGAEAWNPLRNTGFPIREIPDHETFREKEHTLCWLDKLGSFLSLALRNLANFEQQ